MIELTKREIFSAMAMQGLLSSDLELKLDSDDVAIFAVKQADDLILELEKVVDHE